MLRGLNAGLIGLAVLATSSWAFDRSNIDQAITDLKSTDAKVRAAALADLGSVFIDMNFAMMDVETDDSPEVAAARLELKKKLEAKWDEKKLKRSLTKTPQQLNENAAEEACKLYAEAQEIYHRTDYSKAGVRVYAQHLKGDNSLLETKTGKNDIGLVDEVFGSAEGNPGKASPKAGYCFKILTKQGSNATGGAKDYIADGKMTLGYALIAYPAEYSKAGTNCFIINNAGVVYKKDLGPETPAAVEKMTEFDPDKTWTPVK